MTINRRFVEDLLGPIDWERVMDRERPYETNVKCGVPGCDRFLWTRSTAGVYCICCSGEEGSGCQGEERSGNHCTSCECGRCPDPDWEDLYTGDPVSSGPDTGNPVAIPQLRK